MNKTQIISVVSALAMAGAQGALIDGLVNYWPLDNSLNDAAHGVAGSASSVADNGTFAGVNGTGGISFTSGLFGGATLQDGATGVAQNNGHVLVSTSADTNFAGENLTTSLWVQVGSLGFDTGWQAAISHGEGTNYRIARRAATSGMGYAGGVGEGADIVAVDVTSGWHHLLATTESGVATNFYIDGVLVSTGGVPLIADPGALNLNIGANPGTGDQNREWNGNIDDVAQWNRVLTPEEIATIYGGGFQSASSLGTIIGVPEPGSTALLALASLGLLRRRRG